MLKFKGGVFLQFIRGMGGFGGFALINQVGAFLLIPIYWQYLTPDDYGTIGIFSIVINVLSALLTFGLNGAVERFYHEWTLEERPSKIRTIWYFQLLIMLILSSISFCFFYFDFFDFSSVDFFPTVFLAILCSFFLVFQFIPFSILRVTQNISQFGFLSLLSFFLTSFITLFSLEYLELGLEGYLYSQFFSAGLMSIVWVLITDKYMKSGRIVSVREEFKFASPNLPLNIISKTSEVLDRVILEKTLALSTLGLYVVAHRFGSYFGNVNSVMKLAYYPLIYKRVANGKGSPIEVSKLSLFYVFIQAKVALLVMLFFEAFVLWFGDKQFYGSFDYISMIITIFFIKGFTTAFGIGIEIAKVPQKAFYAVIPSSLSAILLMLILIPSYGIVGALFSLFFSVSLKALITVYLGYQAYPRPFPLMKLLWIASIFTGSIFMIDYYRIVTFGDLLLKVQLICLISAASLVVIYPRQVFLVVNKGIRKITVR